MNMNTSIESCSVPLTCTLNSCRDGLEKTDSFIACHFPLMKIAIQYPKHCKCIGDTQQVPSKSFAISSVRCSHQIIRMHK